MDEKETIILSEKETEIVQNLLTDKDDIVIELKNYLRNLTGRSLSFEHIDNGLSLQPGSTKKYIGEAAGEMGLLVVKGDTIFELRNPDSG